MSPGRTLTLIALTIPVFLVVDGIWLGIVAKSFYSPRIGHLMAARVNWLAAASFYLLFVVGVVILAVLPALEKGSWAAACARGALLGLVAYGTYDLTNLATLRDWPLLVTVVDLLWGTVLAALTASVSYWIGVRLR